MRVRGAGEGPQVGGPGLSRECGFEGDRGWGGEAEQRLRDASRGGRFPYAPQGYSVSWFYITFGKRKHFC